MSESVLNALVHLFALVASVTESGLSKKGKEIVYIYLKRYLSETQIPEYTEIFNNYYSFYHKELYPENSESGKRKSLDLIRFQTTNVTRQVRKELDRLERIIVFIQLLEFVIEDQKVTPEEEEIIKGVTAAFRLEKEETNRLKHFVFGKDNNIPEDYLLTVKDRQTQTDNNLPSSKKYIHRKNFKGDLCFLILPGIKLFLFKYNGSRHIHMEGHKINPGRFYLFKPGSIIKGTNLESIYYHDVVSVFYPGNKVPSIFFGGQNLSYRFRKSANGIHPFNFCESSGNLIGILGGSGVGKSTLLNLINGKIQPDKGSVQINGYDINKYRIGLQGMIGFVPQDDMLFENLTVYQNLYYNARLCFGEETQEEVQGRVGKILRELDLEDIAHLKVGDPLNKFISGGQRKRLNIGLELMREPYILILDEPTSGLSSRDSDNIVRLLKEQTYGGRLVIATIHQPSSEIFKLFDRLWVLDKGGYPVYTGNPVDAVEYFKQINTQVNAVESECPACGNIDTEEILEIIEKKELNEEGDPVATRKISPEQWYKYYKEKIESKLQRPAPSREIPEVNYKTPSASRQFRVFFFRNLRSKLSNTQYLIINLFEAPVLALILGFFTKYIKGNEYVFQNNKNLPVFLFMAIVVSLFMGLTVSAEAVVRDRKILERESFLNLSWPSYVNSKILFLFGLSAIQTISFVVIGNAILGIQGMTFIYWLILFSSATIGNLIGLNISSGLDSIIAIYILIPLILVPQLLLGGAMIRFDDLNKDLTNQKFVPFIGDLMITRWAYEAFTVTQFKSNAFEKNFFDDEQIISTANYHNTFLIPELEKKLHQCLLGLEDSPPDTTTVVNNLQIVGNEFKKMVKFQEVPPFELAGKLRIDSVNREVLEETLGYLSYLKILFSDKENEATRHKEEVYNNMAEKIGKENLIKLREDYYNNKLADLVLNRQELQKTVEYKHQIVRKMEPVFIMPENKWGRAQFYAPFKRVVNQLIETLWFNIVIIWIGSLTLYFMLLTEILRKTLIFLSRLRLQKAGKILIQ